MRSEIREIHEICQICQNVFQVSSLFASLRCLEVSRHVSQVDLQSPGAFAGRWSRFALGQGDDDGLDVF